MCFENGGTCLVQLPCNHIIPTEARFLHLVQLGLRAVVGLPPDTMLVPVGSPKTGSSMHLFQTSGGVGSFVSKKHVLPETMDRSQVSYSRAKLAKDVGFVCVLTR